MPIVDDCFNTGASSACNLISRDATTNATTRILNQYINAGNAQTRGVDLELIYSRETNFFGDDAENFSLRGLIGYLAENSTKTAAVTINDAVGVITRPEYTATITGNYTVGSYGMMLQANYYDSTLNANNSTTNNATWIEGRDVDDNTVASQATFNMGLFYNGELDSSSAWRLAFNITNLFDRDPPIIAGGGGQIISNSHDSLGRRYQLGLNMDF